MVRNGEMEIKFCGQESTTFPLGTEKEQRSDKDIWLSLTTSSSASPGLGHSAQVTQAGSLAQPGAGFREGGQVQLYILLCPETNGTSK